MCSLPKSQTKTPKFGFALMLADAIQAYSGGELTVTGPTATAGIFSTYPADYLSMWGGVVDQVVRPPPPPLVTVHEWKRACKSRRVSR